MNKPAPALTVKSTVPGTASIEPLSEGKARVVTTPPPPVQVHVNLLPDETIRPIKIGSHVIVIERRIYIGGIEEETYSAEVTAIRPNDRVALRWGRKRRGVCAARAFSRSPRQLGEPLRINYDTGRVGCVCIWAACRNLADHAAVARACLDIEVLGYLSRMLNEHACSVTDRARAAGNA